MGRGLQSTAWRSWTAGMLVFLGLLAALPAGAAPSGRHARPPRLAATPRPTSQAKKPVAREDPPPPDPLKGSWTAGGHVQLGNGTLRSEVLVSALRLLGLRESFDEDTFIRHVFYVNALARKDDLGGDWAGELARRLVARSILHKDRARKGDVILFRLGSAGQVLAGIVESASKGRVTFIAPLAGMVTRGTATLAGGRAGGDTPLVKCAPAKAPRSSRDGNKRSGKTAKPAPLPCRAGDLLLGIADVDAAAKAVAR